MGGVSKLTAPFKEAIEAQDAAGGPDMCVDRAAAISTCMTNLGFMENMQQKKNHVPTFAAYCGGCTRDEVKKMLAKVGFSPDGKTTPDHTVSTLTGVCFLKLALVHAMLQRAHGMATDTLLPQTRPWSGSQDASIPDVFKHKRGCQDMGWHQ